MTLAAVRSAIVKVPASLALAFCIFAVHGGTVCDDLLATLGKKPKNLEFLDCKQKTELQGEPWEATYRVPGSHAAQVENYLIKELHIKKLQRTCCSWESSENSYRDNNNRLFVISIAAEETTVDKKEQWDKVPYFYIKATLYREDP